MSEHGGYQNLPLQVGCLKSITTQYQSKKAKQRCVMGVGMCLYAQLVQMNNTWCKSAIIMRYHPYLSGFCSRPRLRPITQPLHRLKLHTDNFMQIKRKTEKTQLYVSIHKQTNAVVCYLSVIMPRPIVVVVVVVVVVEYLYSASRSASNALIVPQRCEEMSL